MHFVRIVDIDSPYCYRHLRVTGTRTATAAHSRAQEVIRDKSEELKASTVVVGSHGKGLLQRALLGSVSSYLAHNVARPLVIVPSTK